VHDLTVPEPVPASGPDGRVRPQARSDRRAANLSLADSFIIRSQTDKPSFTRSQPASPG
jgi:hypothetical protein